MGYEKGADIKTAGAGIVVMVKDGASQLEGQDRKMSETD